MEDRYQRETFDLERDHWWYRARRRIILSTLETHLPKSHKSEPRPSGSGFSDRPPPPRHAENLRILEIGCGAGTILRELRRFGDAVGIDQNADAVRQAEQRSGCDVHLGGIPDGIPDDVGRFDAVCLFDVIEHLDDDAVALRSIAPLLSPDGQVFITVPALPSLFGVHDRINQHRRRYTRRSLKNALTAAGFVTTRCSYFNTLLSPMLIPTVAWRNARNAGHNFKLRSSIEPLLERIFATERYLLRITSLPIGMSLLAVARKGKQSTVACAASPSRVADGLPTGASADQPVALG